MSNLKSSAHRKGNDGRHYVNFFQIGALELEHWRREQEKEAARKRAADIDRRLAEIKAEIDELLRDTGIEQAAGTGSRSAGGSDKKGFNIKY